MLRFMICAIIIATSYLNASQAAKAVVQRPRHQIDGLAIVQKLPKDLQGLVGEFLAGHKKINKEKPSTLYQVSKEFLPILLPQPCTEYLAYWAPLTKLEDICIKNSHENRRATGGIISPRTTMSDPIESWVRQRPLYLNNATYNFEKDIKDLLQICEQENLAIDEAVLYGDSDKGLFFFVHPDHERTISNLSIEQKQFLIDLYKLFAAYTCTKKNLFAGYPCTNKKKPIIFDASHVRILRTFSPEFQARILANYPIQMPFSETCYQHYQNIRRNTRRYSKTCIFVGIMAVAAISWIVWKKMHRAKT